MKYYITTEFIYFNRRKMHIILKIILSGDSILRYYTGQATEFNLGGC